MLALVIRLNNKVRSKRQFLLLVIYLDIIDILDINSFSLTYDLLLDGRDEPPRPRFVSG